MVLPLRKPASLVALLLSSFVLLAPSLSPADDRSQVLVQPGSAQGTVETTFLPVGDLFKPLIADLKQPRFFVSYRRYHYRSDIINIAAVGVGEIFGLHRVVDKAEGTGWQVSFEGGLFAQFDLDASSKDLLNADYIAGVPFTYRKGPTSYRVNLYHLSSHLGDEFMLHEQPQRLEFSYEALSAVASHEWREWRGYVGGESFLRKKPRDLKPLTAQAGIEYYGSSPMWGRGMPVGGLDLKSTQEHDWSLNASVAAGLEFRGSSPGNRYIRILLEGYRGYNPHGQFYTEDIRIAYYGLGVYLGY